MYRNEPRTIDERVAAIEAQLRGFHASLVVAGVSTTTPPPPPAAAADLSSLEATVAGFAGAIAAASAEADGTEMLTWLGGIGGS